MDLAARKAIDAIENGDNIAIDEYTDHRSDRYRAMVEWIRQYIGLTTLQYQHLDDLIEAIDIPREKLCTYCWSGKDPSE